MNQLVIGMGEVGTALTEVLECDGADIEGVAGRDRPDILHIVYPYSPSFIADTRDYERALNPGLVVVHSTVPVGTCDANRWVHSPVRGRHPNLSESLIVFTKQFGGKRAWEGAEYWPGEVAAYPEAVTTEAAKLFELAQFGLQVRIVQSIYQWCDVHGADPDVVYGESAEIYNTGYSKLGEDQFIRPVLHHVPGDIGGHCVTQNAELLDHRIAKLVTEGLI